MSKIFLTIVFALAFAFPVLAQQPTYIIDSLDALDNKSEMMVYVNIKASEYKVSPKLMKCLIKHENRQWQPELQSGIYSNGKREQSYGLAQIHLPSHPYVSLEEATDPKFAIDFIASEVSKGRAGIWSTYKFCK